MPKVGDIVYIEMHDIVIVRLLGRIKRIIDNVPGGPMASIEFQDGDAWINFSIQTEKLRKSRKYSCDWEF